MAISGTLHKLLRSIQPMLPRDGTLLEIGEANWYGDAAPDFPCKDGENLFSIAKDLYADLFAPSEIVSIDMNGTPAALKFDLNNQFSLDKQFDVVMNHGTAEHVFNIAQVFKTIHDHCGHNGVMIHDAPFTAWIDHGFYCLQPTLFYDLAMANCYEVSHVSMYEIKSGWSLRVDSRDHVPHVSPPPNTNLFVVLKKRMNLPFKLPTQGYYARTISAEGAKAWEINR